MKNYPCKCKKNIMCTVCIGLWIKRIASVKDPATKRLLLALFKLKQKK